MHYGLAPARRPLFVAEAGYSHDSLWRAATLPWHRDGTSTRAWWWYGQAVIELRHGDEIELVLSETTWPVPIFAGRAKGRTLIGVDWRGRPLEMLDRGDTLAGPGIRLAGDVVNSAHATVELP